MYNLYTPHKEDRKQMSKIVSFRIDDGEYEVLAAYAKEYDATISWAARRAIKEFTTKLTKENKYGEKDNLCVEGNGATCKDGSLSGSDTTQS